MQCELCGSAAVHLYCNCRPRTALICAECIPAHNQTHSSEISAQEEGVDTREDRLCSWCGMRGKHICVKCKCYACGECDKRHKEWCQTGELLPIGVAGMVMEGEVSLDRLNRGIRIQKASALLKSTLQSLHLSLTAEIESVFSSYLRLLEQSKQAALVQLAQEVARIGLEIEAFDARLLPIRFNSDLRPTTVVEKMVLTADFKQVAERLKIDKLLKIYKSDETEKRIAGQSVRVERGMDWFEGICEECEWAGRYALLPGDVLRFCELSTLTVSSSTMKYPLSSTTFFLPLPSGEFFLYEGSKNIILLIDNSYVHYYSIGHLVTARLAAGLVYVSGAVLVFGGVLADSQIDTRIVEQFEMSSRESRIGCEEMKLSRKNFVPCVWGQKVYLIGDIYPDGEVFDLPSETFRLLPLRLPHYGPSVLLPTPAGQLIILSSSIHIFDLTSETITEKQETDYVFQSRISPVRYEGKYYFEAYKDDRYWLVAFDSDRMDIQNTDIEMGR